MEHERLGTRSRRVLELRNDDEFSHVVFVSGRVRAATGRIALGGSDGRIGSENVPCTGGAYACTQTKAIYRKPSLYMLGSVSWLTPTAPHTSYL